MGHTDRDFEEKRDFIRMQLNSTAKLHSQGSQPIDVICHDLSATGMSIIATEPLTLGSEVTIDIPSPNAQFEPMSSKGQVVRCDPYDDETRFLVGVEISNIS
ncbi:PilZ domain-containing protein [Reinekea thalattae]|uniref:PilZ domain-containing protein n=1 Tax=Reinekea thalattae TaxID=2593301 RepID=A0A5C8Z6G4_9GAMM|nr:PilZ domain-containing protein [Reinekea thalattae]TXR53217.1 PilZ domain-containing protein [Reinekea thalattae]